MKFIREFARYIVAGLFIFSGLIKINDPVGTAIKLEEYFNVFATDIAPFFEFFIPAALFLSVFLSVLEVLLGIALILGYRMKFTSWTLLVIIVFFSFLTFYSAKFDKVTDCGCFGDAIKLTPWQSFFKDVILLGLTIIIFKEYHKYKAIFKSKLFGDIKIIIATIALIITAVYAIKHLPYVDFRNYKVGNHIPKLMKNSAALKYEYVMKKDGKEYTFDKYPTDKSYEYVSSKLKNPDALPKIVDLKVWNGGQTYTDDLLKGNKLVVVFHNIKKSTKNKEKIAKIREVLADNPIFEPWIVTSTGGNDFEKYRHQNQLSAPVYFADATVLKAMIRSNPGVILFKNGTVVGKFHYNDVPSQAEIISLFQ